MLGQSVDGCVVTGNVCWFRYGVEPPVLVKLEKEIELEESLMMTDHASPVKTFTVCCQHGALYHAVSITDIKPPTLTDLRLLGLS